MDDKSAIKAMESGEVDSGITSTRAFGDNDHESVLDGNKRKLEQSMDAISGTAMVVSLIIGSGIFTTPASVWSLAGSAGMAMVMWAIGGILTYFGAMSYIELGTMLPKSGGEQAYLAYAFKRPKYLFAFIFCWTLIVCIRPGSEAASSVVFGKYILFAGYGSPTTLEDGYVKDHYDWLTRGLGIFCITSVTLLNSLSIRWTLRLLNLLTAVKLLVLLIISIGGIVVLAGGIDRIEMPNNWHNSFENTATDASAYSLILFKLYWAYGGWNNLNFSLGELKNPNRNLPIASLGGLTIVTILFLFVNIAFISVVPAAEAFASKEIIAATFANIVFGKVFGQHILPVFISLSSYGAVCSMTFAVSRVIFAAARENYLPGSRYLGRLNLRFGTPIYALVVNWTLVMIMMLSPPPGEAFDFLIDLIGYPQSIVYGAAVCGMLWLRRTEPEKERPFCAWWPLSVVFVLVSAFVSIYPFVPPTTPSGSSIPYYLSSLLGFILMFFGLPLWYIMIPNRGNVRQAWQSLFNREKATTAEKQPVITTMIDDTNDTRL
ncbi:amino acid/polyamine transporter I [Syncephalis plumigaleata]|nr:amino acid/polyamine transporter I [Syncephalis plumigaleata]